MVLSFSEAMSSIHVVQLHMLVHGACFKLLQEQ
jgi:hypothetical protein